MTMPIQFVAMPTSLVHAYQNGRLDDNGQPPERHCAHGTGIPCRHCLQPIAAGEPYLVLAHRPFPSRQPYAEVGPIFLHANACPRYDAETTVIPPILESEQYIVRGYGVDDRIVYGTGQVVETAVLPQKAVELLTHPDVAYLHVRSAANNCFQCRIDSTLVQRG